VHVRKVRHSIAAIVAVAVAVALIPAANAAAAPDYGSLTAQWWEWVYDHQAIDVGGTNTFPILDTTGQFAAVGQENGIGPANKYFFLVGTFGGDATRTVTVPRGKALFFPIINFETDNAVPDPQGLKVPALRQQAADVIDSTTVKTAFFDGNPVLPFRATSPVFDYTLPPQNSIYAYFGPPFIGPQFEGRVKPAVSDGYWAYVPPPTPGLHTVEFSGANSSPFSLHVVYHLTVA
jgi:hypothetical protein